MTRLRAHRRNLRNGRSCAHGGRTAGARREHAAASRPGRVGGLDAGHLQALRRAAVPGLFRAVGPDRLVTVKDPKILEYSEEELRRLHAAVKDPNFRIFTDRETITVFNDQIFVRGTEIQEIFSQLGVDEATHAFYLGRELMKAKLAITLGKTYRQEGALAWGYLTPPDDVRSEHVKLTARRKRPARPDGA